MIEKIFLLIMCHMIGDFLLQTDYLANTKGSHVIFIYFIATPSQTKMTMFLITPASAIGTPMNG